MLTKISCAHIKTRQKRVSLMLSGQKDGKSLSEYRALCLSSKMVRRRQKEAILKICIYVFLIKTTNKMTFSTSIEKNTWERTDISLDLH